MTMTKKSSLVSRFNKNSDGGYIFMMALLIFVLLSATTVVILGATHNQLAQTQQNRQFTEKRQGITAAVSDALNTLNQAGYTDSMPNYSDATRKHGTAAKADWSWYFDKNTNTIHAKATVFIVNKEGVLVPRYRDEEIAVDYSDVASTRNNADGLPVYSTSALGAWRDAVAFKAGSTGTLTATGRIGLYDLAQFNTDGSTVSGDRLAVSHDNKNTGGVPANVTKTLSTITTSMDIRTNQAIASSCSWQEGPFIGGVVTTGPTVDCYTGFNTKIPITIHGAGVKTIVIRENTEDYYLDKQVINSSEGGQLHVIFTKQPSDRALIIGSSVYSPSISGLFIYGPDMGCSSVGESAVISGSLICNNLKDFKGTVNWLEPTPADTDGVSRRIWFKAP